MFYLNREDLKNQLLSNIDDIVDAIIKDKTVELKKERDNLCVFCISKKKLIKIK